MVYYELTYRVTSKTLKVYDEWDVRDKEVIYDWDGVIKEDIGKFIAFDDGSNLYAEILGVTDTCIATNIGKFRIDDIVHCCRVKWPNANYSGAIASEESLYVRPPSPREKGTATRLLEGEDIPAKYITPRIKMLTIERLQELAEERGISSEFIMEKIQQAASDPEGRNFKFSMEFLIKILGDSKLLGALGAGPKQIENRDNGSAVGRFISTKNNVVSEEDTFTVMNTKTLKTLIRKVDKKDIPEAIIEEEKDSKE